MNTTPSRPRRAHPPVDWRNRLLRIFAAFLAVAMLASAHTRTASADPCRIIIGDPTPPVCGTAVPDLLSVDALSGSISDGLYLATTAQTTSLQVLEQAAVSATIRDHRLAAGDADAVQSWGRGDAQAELWALIVQAIQTPAASRSTDQQNAVAWMTTVFQREGVRSADNAGREYVKWAGLDQTQYQQLLDTNASQGAITAFLANNNLPPSGYCDYRSPAPFEKEYTGYQNQTCVTPCTNVAGCIPFPPDYNQFVRWGTALANGTTLNTPAFAQQASSIVQGEVLGGTIAAAGALGAVIGTNAALAGVLSGSAFQLAVFPFAGGVIESSTAAAMAAAQAAGEAAGETAAEAAAEAAAEVATAAAETAGSIAAASVGVIVAIAIAGIAVGVIYLIDIINALNLPGQLASLIVGATTTPVLDATLLNDATQVQGLYSLFVGATLPIPRFATCNNAIGIVIGGTGRPILPPCRNAPAIPAPANADPVFAIQAKGGTTTTYATSISWKDAAAGVSTTARLSETWFIDQVSAPGLPATTLQTLRIHYTDWSGNEQYGWLLGDPADGYKFLAIAESGASHNPSTCLADKTCSYSSSIDYVGTDGADYAASVTASGPPTVSSSISANPVEGSPVAFTASGASPLGLAITYQWEFQQANQLVVCPVPPVAPCDGVAYGAPVTGAQASYTWPTSGTFYVRLTAIDSAGHRTLDRFTVAVGDVPPTLALSATDAHTVLLGGVTTLNGTLTHAGGADTESVDVDWGDGIPGLLDLFQTSDGSLDLTLSFAQRHTYVAPGVYPVTVTVTDQAGGTASMTTTETVTWPAPAAITYGAALGTAQLNAPASVPGAFTYKVDGSPVTAADNKVLPAGTHTLTAQFTPTDTATYRTPGPVSVPLTVNQAPLTISSNTTTTWATNVNSITAASYGGLVNGDTASVFHAGTCGLNGPFGILNFYIAGSMDPGVYGLICAGFSADNYAISYPPGQFTITREPLTVTANDKNMTYGGPMPTFDSSFRDSHGVAFDASFRDFRGVAAGLSCGTADDLGHPLSSYTPAGRYPITCSGGSAGLDYSLSYVAGTLTITKAPLTITADNKSTVYGQTHPSFTVTPDGLLNGDTLASLQGTLGFATTATQFSAPGQYALTPSGLSSPDYAISYGAGTLTITQVPQTITFGALPNRLLGAAPFTVSASGGASGNPVTFSAAPSSVCTAGGTNGATITLVGVGACTVTATQAGSQNYLSAPSVAQSFTASYPPLYLAQTVTSSPPGRSPTARS